MLSIASSEVIRRGFARPREPAACVDAPSPPLASPDAGCLPAGVADARFAGRAAGVVSWRCAVLVSDVFPAVFVDVVEPARPDPPPAGLRWDVPLADLPTVVLSADFDALDGLARVPVLSLPVRAAATLGFAAGFFAAAVLRAAALPATDRALVDLPATAVVRAWVLPADLAPAPAAVVRGEACLPAAGLVDADRVEGDFVAAAFFAAAFAGAARDAADLPEADRVDAVLPAARPELVAAEVLLPVPARPVAAFPVVTFFVAGLLAPVFSAADLRGRVVAMRVSRRTSPSAATCPR